MLINFPFLSLLFSQKNLILLFFHLVGSHILSFPSSKKAVAILYQTIVPFLSPALVAKSWNPSDHDSLSHYLLSNNLLSDHQHGFIKSRSPLTNLLSSLRHWLTSLDSGNSTDVLYMDFAKAFDSVSHSKLLHKLKSYNILGKLHNWISAWLTGQSQSVKIQNIFSSFKCVLSGILQGSVLGPLLFLVFINDLCDLIPPEAHPSFFADDLKLFSDEIPIVSGFLPNTCPHHFSKTLLMLSFTGPIYGSFLFLYLSALCCLSPTQSLLNLVSTLLAPQTFLFTMVSSCQ